MIDSHSAMRVARRTCWSSPASAAEATSGVTACAKPDPTMNVRKKNVPAMVDAASAVTEYHPSMIVSVIWIANCARWLRTSGIPSFNTARVWSVGVVALGCIS